MQHHTLAHTLALALASAFLASALAGPATGQSMLLESYGVALGDQAGRSVAGGADFDGDGWPDIVVGSPLRDTGGRTDNGSVRLISGQDGSKLQTKVGDADLDHFGWSVAVLGDVDGDGTPEVLVGAPNALNGGLRTGMARVFSGRTGVTLYTVYGDDDADEFGFAVAGGFDLDGDGIPDFVVGAPNAQMLSAAGRHGGVRLFSGATASLIRDITGPMANSRYGTSVCTSLDFNGDGVHDVAFGGPGSAGKGVVRIFDTVGGLSIVDLWGAAAGDEFGASLASGFDLDSDGFSELLVGSPGDSGAGAEAGCVILFNGQDQAEVTRWTGTAAFDRLGTSVALLGDLGGNALPEFAAGAPETGVGPGSARIFSVNVAAERYRVTGTAGSELGTSVAAVGDLNLDGIPDFAVGAPLDGEGFVRVYSGGGPGIVNYCTSGTSASGCQAAISALGLPSASANNGFFLGAFNVEGNKNGIFFYGANGRQATPWGNGASFQCVVPPVKRGGLLSGNGTNGACDGAFVQDLNARWCPTCPKASHNFGAGAVVQAQLWYRDPSNTSNQGTSLSNAIEFVVGP